MNAKILVVEDDVIVANNLRDRLKGLGHTVCGLASSGEEALEEADRLRPDLVLMDIKLRGALDGISASQEIRKRFDIPVIYLTGYADDATLQRAKLSEPYGYILKPFEVRETHTTIEMALHKHAVERRLKESEEKYRTLVEHSLQGIMVVQGIPPRIIFANPPCARIIGYSVDELLALPADKTMTLVHPEDRTWLLNRLVDHVSGEPVPATDEFRVVRKDGDVRWVEYYASLIERSGQPATQMAFVDVTERKLASEALQEAHDDLEKRVEVRTAELANTNVRLRAEIDTRMETELALQRRNRELEMLNRVAQSLSSSLDLDYVLVQVLEEARHLLDAVGCTVWLLDPGSDTLICRQAVGPYGELLDGWKLRLGEGIVGWTARHGESVIVVDTRADGRHFKKIDLQTGLEIRSLLSVPLRVKQKLIGVLQAVDNKPASFDATDLALLEAMSASAAIAIENARLYDETNKLRTFNEDIVQGMQEGILVEDATGYLSFANPAAADLLGYTVDELQGCHRDQILAPGRESTLESVGHDQPRSSRYETEFLTKDGRRLPVIVSTRSQFDNGQYGGRLAAFTDITERKQAEESLRQRAEELSQLNMLSQQVSASLSLDEVVDTALSWISDSIGPDLAMLYLRQDKRLLLLGAKAGELEWQPTPLDAHRVGNCLCGHAVSEGEAVYSLDVQSDERCTLDDCKAAGLRSFAALPLLKGTDVLGVLGLACLTSRDFSGQSAFLAAMAGTVAIGLQNALLHNEVQIRAADLEQEVAERRLAEAALRQRTERLEAIHEIDRAILEAQSSEAIAQSCLNHIRDLVPCQRVSVVLFDHKEGMGTFLAVYTRGATRIGAGTRQPLEAFGVTEALRQGNIRVIEEIPSPPPDGSGDTPQPGPMDQELLAEGVHSYAVIPLMAQGRLIGTLNIGVSHPDLLLPEHIDIAREVAGPLAVSVQQARLREQVEQDAIALEKHVAQLQLAEGALRESEERFRNLFDNAPLGIFEIDLAQTPYTIVQANQQTRSVYGWSPAEFASLPLAEIFANASDLERLFDALHTGEASTLESTHQRRDGSRFPVRVSAAPVSAAGPPLAILAVEDITAEKSRRSEEEAIAEERRRIAREIHDGLAQNLASLRLKARLWHNLIEQNPEQMHAEVEAMRELLKDQIREVRRSIFALRPVALDELGFSPALHQFVNDFGEQNQLRIHLQTHGAEDRLPSLLEPVLFRIVQEALNNISKHAQASTAWVELDLRPEASTTLTIRDDGQGFDPDLLDEATRFGHLGLTQMHERVEELGGSFVLQSQTGKGTEIQVILPTSGI